MYCNLIIAPLCQLLTIAYSHLMKYSGLERHVVSTRPTRSGFNNKSSLPLYTDYRELHGDFYYHAFEASFISKLYTVVVIFFLFICLVIFICCRY